MPLQFLCYGFVKSCFMTRYLSGSVSLIGIGPCWGQIPQYAKILKAPCELTGNGFGFRFQQGPIHLGKSLAAKL